MWHSWLMRSVREFRREIDVAAPAERVWAVLCEVERWPEWTESMAEITALAPGGVAVGSQFRVLQPRLPVTIWTVTELAKDASFAWASRAGIITSFADHQVTPAADGCRVELLFRQTGPLAWLSALIFGRLIRTYLSMEAEGLKRRAEQGTS